MTLALQDWMILVGFALFFLAFFALVVYSAKRRRDEITRALTDRGFRVTMKPTPDEKSAAFACVGVFPELRNGSDGITWFAQADAGGMALTLAEHTHFTGAGKSRRTIFHTISATPAPPNWPMLTLEPENIMHRLFEGLIGKDIRLEDPAFNKRWRVSCSSEEFAILVLTPQVQQWCMSLDTGVSIAIGHGYILVVMKLQVKPTALGTVAERPRELLELIPKELRMFGAR